ncbi:MAG: hypothetical protein EBV35_04120 [Betaproteobacteria bacterium]|nr:hypothetical protein [Betaproteobacteria bacterium]NBS92395.1 hypothetical protein [Betaproteobacteria bacterium]
MSRDLPPRFQREAIAQAAARMIAEDGLHDYALAKRKAARQLGVTGNQQLPNNDEIDAALRAYREVFQTGTHPELLYELRSIAAQVMQELATYQPQLTGSVLAGTAGPESDINLLLFADSDKDVEIDLLNRGIPFETGERKRQLRGETRKVPVLTVFVGDAVVNLEVLEPRDRFDRPRGNGNRAERADLPAVQQLLDSQPE